MNLLLYFCLQWENKRKFYNALFMVNTVAQRVCYPTQMSIIKSFISPSKLFGTRPLKMFTCHALRVLIGFISFTDNENFKCELETLNIFN